MTEQINTTRRKMTIALPMSAITLHAPYASANIKSRLITAAGRAIVSFFKRIGRKRVVTPAATRSAKRGLTRMESSGFTKYREEFIGGVLDGTGSVVGESLTTTVISAIRPTKENGIVYCAAIGTDCNGIPECVAQHRLNPPEGDRFVTGGFQEIDKQVVLIEEANAIGLEKVSLLRANQGWKDAEIALAYYPVGFIKREVLSAGRNRQQRLTYLTIAGSVTTEEEIDYSTGAGKIKITTRLGNSTFSDDFTFIA